LKTTIFPAPVYLSPHWGGFLGSL